jgi:hypothetical protein
VAPAFADRALLDLGMQWQQLAGLPLDTIDRNRTGA